MKLFSRLVAVILYSSLSTAQNTLQVDSATIVYTKPNQAVWILDRFDPGSEKSRATVMFKHKPILDSLQRPVQPVIAFHYDKVKENIDPIEYSINYVGLYPFKREPPEPGYPKYSDDISCTVFQGLYSTHGVSHKLIVAYLLRKHVGVEIIMDSTEEIFPKVATEMFAFLKSVSIK